MESRDHQKNFLQKIKNLSSPNISFVNELAEILNVSVDSAYRRIRGETVLGFDEVITLCDFYKISLQTLQSSQSEIITFNYQTLYEQEKFESHWKNMLSILKAISLNKGKIIYAADDIPIFHHFQFAEHAAFKMFFWMRSFLNIDSLADKKFSLNLLPPQLNNIISQIYEAYLDCHSIEIWTEESANSTLNQIEYYWDSGLFENSEDAIIVTTQLLAIIKTIQGQAKYKSKRNEGDFELYQSELQVGNNCVLINIGSVKSTFIRHQTFNLMSTDNDFFCEETEFFLQKLIQKSILISGVSEKQRHQFFSGINVKIAKLLEKITRTNGQ